MSGCRGMGLQWVEGNQQGTRGLVEQQAGRWLAGLVLPVTQKMDVVSALPNLSPGSFYMSIHYAFTS